ncbi:hypothetical protein SLE2022_333900 [Rubroshorea leprosula]
MAVVCRDANGTLLDDGIAFRQHVSSILVADALAPFAAVGLATSSGVQRVIFESDCNRVYFGQHYSGLHPMADPLVLSICSPSATSDSCNFDYVPHEANKVVNCVARHVQRENVLYTVYLDSCSVMISLHNQ